MTSISKLKLELRKNSSKDKAKIFQRFFKTAPGEYGEGDVFLGLTVPVLRQISNKYSDISLDEVRELLGSKIHEHRQCALFILIDKYNKAENKKEIFEIYANNYKNINNWDLVDLSAPKILGDYLLNRDRNILYQFACSDNLWKKRIAIVSTYTFIKNNDFEDTIKISEILLNDNHDLIHKAVGWMLREVGKRDLKTEEEFLKKHYKKMPRTMLRYSIERFPEKKRKFYMKKF